MKTFKSKALVALVIALVLCMSSVSGMACTAIYVGSNLTEDGSTMFARSEDISNSYNKVFYVSPAGNHKAGEEYEGCHYMGDETYHGFKYTFTKDSYSYTAFSDDKGAAVENYCPDCGSNHIPLTVIWPTRRSSPRTARSPNGTTYAARHTAWCCQPATARTTNRRL